MGVPSSRVSHQACSSELDPGELSSNGILGNRGLIHVRPLDLKAHAPRKGQLYSGVARYFKEPPQTGSPTALWQNYCRECTLADQSSRGMLFVLGLLVPVVFFVRPVIPWDAVCGRLHLLSNAMLGFSALPLATFDAGTPGWPIQVSPRMTSFIGMPWVIILAPCLGV